jgi:hypothetical protein
MFAVLLALGMFNGEGGFATPFRLAVVGSGRLMNYPALTGRGINVSYAAFQSNSVAV